MATQTDTTSSHVGDINPALKEMVATVKMPYNLNHSLHLYGSSLIYDDTTNYNILTINIFTKSKHAVSESYWQAHEPPQMTPTYPSTYYTQIQNEIPSILEVLLIYGHHFVILDVMIGQSK
ncbi:MAG: hypothetical protein TREMPRED_005255 [Tremellales sp. Tagirdzhanova-0007]|nr:MAG: hypothetical protein TREMPRED_005255 [Tremellales sp. Tagirdzhanova-0007]